MKRKGNKILEEFKEFINQGNAMDLAVGMVIGAAFGKIVSSLVGDIIMPVIGVLIGGIDFSDLVITIPNFMGGDMAAHIQYGNFIQNVVDFLIVAFALFIVIRAVNRMNEQARLAAEKAAKKLGKEVEEKDKEEKKKEEKENKAERKSDEEIAKLLTEIRDELKKKTKSKR